jgi:hypothetical protein
LIPSPASKRLVAEVKSLTTKDEEKQLSLALDDQMRHESTVIPMLAAERRPSDRGWESYATELECY